MARLKARLASCTDTQAHRFYSGALIMWRSVLAWNRRHVRALRQAAHSVEGSDRARLKMLARICQRVSRFPEASFHEALQCFYLQHLAVMFENPYGGNGPGRMDQLFWPYLQHDLESGAIT